MTFATGSILKEDSRVAVIGAGAAGIAAIIGLQNAGLRNLTVFEAQSQVGGTWIYSPVLEKFHSSVYKSLRCNIPKQSMCYRDFPFSDDVPSFPKHDNVLNYLQDVAEKEQILQYIRFNTRVARVEPNNPLDFATTWTIQTFKNSSDEQRSKGNEQAEEWSDYDMRATQQMSNSHDRTRRSQLHAGAKFSKLSDSENTYLEQRTDLSQPEEFDAVVVCNGHFSVPCPWLPEDADSFPGRILHSHYYRSPDGYSGKKVVIVGAGPSGVDIGLELFENGADVILSHRDGKGRKKVARLIPQVALVTKCHDSGAVELEDGQIIESVDEILMCTGYIYTFPFLSESSGITVTDDGRAINGLFMHCVSAKHVTLSILGVVYKVLPFPLFEDQIAFIAALLTGRVPYQVCRETIDELLLREMSRRDPKKPQKHLHSLDNEQWEYRRILDSWSGRSFPASSAKEMYEDSKAARFCDHLHYRNREYQVFGEGPGEIRVFLYGEDVTGIANPSTKN